MVKSKVRFPYTSNIRKKKTLSRNFRKFTQKSDLGYRWQGLVRREQGIEWEAGHGKREAERLRKNFHLNSHPGGSTATDRIHSQNLELRA